LEVVGDGRDRALEEGGEEVNRVCVDAGAFVACYLEVSSFGGLGKRRGGGGDNPVVEQWGYNF